MADAYQIIRDTIGITKQLPKKSMFAKDWLSWYRGKVRGFHNYRIYNGTNALELERKTLGMPKFICEAWSNLLLNERCDIVIPDEDKVKLDEILQKTNFWLKANDGIEKSFALGIGAMVVKVKGMLIGDKTGLMKKDTASISVDFVNETKIFPITLEDKEITECAFVSQGTEEMSVVVHRKEEVTGIYKISSYRLNKEGKIIEKYEFNTQSTIPWFFIMRPNISSNFITELVDDEIGISIFANSLDVFKAIDNKYDGFDLEYVLGRKKIFVSTEAWTINVQDGTTTRTFDPYDSLFYHLPEGDSGEPLVTEKSGELRYEAYVKGINTELNYLSMKTGMGENFLKFDGSSIATATQVISENSTLYRNIKKHQILLEQNLINMTKVIAKASNDFTMVKFSEMKDEDITIQFDDSIIEDKGAEMDRDRLDVTAGIMSVPEYRMRWYGEDEDTAKEKYDEFFLYSIMNNYLQALSTGAMTPTQYVEKVFPDATNQEEIIEYITEFVSNTASDVGDYLYEGNESGEDDDEPLLDKDGNPIEAKEVEKEDKEKEEE